MKRLAPAKINLFLDVVGKREDGYHDLCMVMQTVSLYDIINIEKNSVISIDCGDTDIPTDERNTAFRAAKEFFAYTGIDGGCKIKIEKVIPDGGGLGGGSSDAAEVILALNELYGAKLSKEEMISIAVKVGADVPFFIHKGTCLAKGIGEKLTKIKNRLKGTILICCPDFSISAKWAYENLDLNNKKPRDTDALLSHIKSGVDRLFGENTFNVIEDVCCKKFPEIEHIKNIMKKCGAYASLMSGSGSCVFGIFADEGALNAALKKLEKYKLFLAKFI